LEHESFRDRLDRESGSWVNDGLITPEQKARIMARYPRKASPAAKATSGRLITTLSVMGSVLVGVGLILFVASNWSEIPRWGKLAIIFGTMLGSYMAGYIMRYGSDGRPSGHYPKAGAAIIFLGTIIYGAGIWLIAQIFHINAHYPNGVLMWAVGVLPLAYLLRFRSILMLGLLGLLLWVGMEASFDILNVSSYESFGIYAVLYGLAGLVLWGMGIAHRSYGGLKSFSTSFIYLGVVATFTAGLFCTFDIYDAPLGDKGLWIFYGVMAIVAVFGVLMSMFGERSGRPRAAEVVCIVAGVSIALGLAFLNAEGVMNEKLPVVIANNVYAVAVVGLVVIGYMTHSPAYINLGLLFFVIDVFARYFDLFFDLLPRSIFFIMGGVILLAGSIVLERKRRRVLMSFGEEGSR
jgi:uncharacterized membrane protein